MIELIRDELRKARKEYKCDWCGETIKVGENYTYQYCKDSDIGPKPYEWRNHIHCESVVNKFREKYGDLDYYGASKEEFDEICFQACRECVCPHCEHYDSDPDLWDDERCKKNCYYCLDKLVNFIDEQRVNKDDSN